MVRIVAISDTHGKHREIDIPDGDILLHAGDITMIGETKVLMDFNEWIKSLPHKHKIVIAGNHDKTLEGKYAYAKKILDGCTYLQNEGCIVEGLKIWGSPITSTMPAWGFVETSMYKRYDIWNEMPSDLDILLTHTPPKQILDKTINGDEAGDGILTGFTIKNKPKYHFFGHIHESYGHIEMKHTKFYNVSQLNEVYAVQNTPVTVYIESLNMLNFV